MRRNLIFALLIIMVLSLAGCGGGSGGSSSEPAGVNPGVVSKVQLLAVQYVAQTNSSITLRAKVLDGNGRPLPDVTVIFTNLSSPFGFLSAASVVTDKLGFATTQLWSGAEGFATVQVDASGGGAGNVRDIATVFFTSANTLNLFPVLTLSVDGDGDGIFNEADDFILLENVGDQSVIVKATVENGIGQKVFGSTVIFATDAPYRVGADPNAACSDSSTVCEVRFASGNMATTDSNGEATVLMTVTPQFLRSIQTRLNVLASADNGAFNVLGMFLDPVTVDTVIVSADPTTVASGGTSAISAAVTTNLGTPAPDGTIVNFKASSGGVVPFSSVTDGLSKADFTAPTVTSDTSSTITASVGGKSGQTIVAVNAATAPTPSPTPVTLNIGPATAFVNSGTGGTATFTVSGGIAPYNVLSNVAASAFNDNGAGGGTASDGIQNGTEGGLWNVTTDGGSLTVTVPAGAPPGNVTLTVTDFVGATDTATLTITP